MIQLIHPDQRRRTTRSTIGLEILLVLYAMAATVVLIRTVLVLLDISDRIWIGSFVYGLTGPVTDTLAAVPGFAHPLIGPLTMVELILIGGVVLFPLGLVATGGRR
ncbi:MAG TPA: hypothetical protein VNZ55_03695 [Thermomicrobiales bacterium]|nr:hypothetical protein [Thermomicrobiales bacterium]